MSLTFLLSLADLSIYVGPTWGIELLKPMLILALAWLLLLVIGLEANFDVLCSLSWRK